jgi:hypothetical protein
LGLSFLLVYFHEAENVVQFALFPGVADFLEVAELGEGPFERAREALAVEAEIGQGFRLVEEPIDEDSGGIAWGGLFSRQPASSRLLGVEKQEPHSGWLRAGRPPHVLETGVFTPTRPLLACRKGRFRVCGGPVV